MAFAVGSVDVSPPAAAGPVLGPAAQSVADEIAAIGRGQVMTISALRSRLAQRFGAGDFSAAAVSRCLRQLAELVACDLRHHRHARWPIWRVTNDNGQLPGNWPLDARWRAAMLRDEGRVIRYLKSTWFTDSPANSR